MADFCRKMVIIGGRNRHLINTLNHQSISTFIMNKIKTLLVAFVALLSLQALAQDSNYPANYARAPRFKALLFYSDKAEEVIRWPLGRIGAERLELRARLDTWPD